MTLARKPNRVGYFKYLEDLNSRQIANATTYDNALLTLSSAFLGISLTFIKDVVPFETAQCLALLYSSWVAFCLCIISVIASFIYGQNVIDELKINAKKYFIDGDKTLDERSKELAHRISVFNTVSGVLFIAAVAAITSFVTMNVRV